MSARSEIRLQIETLDTAERRLHRAVVIEERDRNSASNHVVHHKERADVVSDGEESAEPAEKAFPRI